jgi:site-specific DNA-methyltransferase (adenine-specific)
MKKAAKRKYVKKKVRPQKPLIVPEWEIERADCVKGMRGLEGLKVRPRLVFADPPFNMGVGYDKHDDNQDVEEYHNWCAEWIAAAYDVLHRYGSFWIAINDENVSELDVMTKGVGFHKRAHVTWYYTFGVSCTKNFARSHTHLLYYTKHRTKFTFNSDDSGLRVPSARQLVYNDKRANPKGKLPDNTWILSPFDLENAFIHSKRRKDKQWLDTWIASRVCGTFHEHVDGALNQMPQEVMKRIVRACSKPGDLVLDPFGGTFSTGEAAISLGRNFHGFDISADYCKRGRARLKIVAQKPATN